MIRKCNCWLYDSKRATYWLPPKKKIIIFHWTGSAHTAAKTERKREKDSSRQKINRVWRFFVCWSNLRAHHHKWDIELLLWTIFFSFIHFKKINLLHCLIHRQQLNIKLQQKVQGNERRDVLEEEELCIPNDARKWRFNLKQIKYKSKKIMQNTVVFWLAGAV